MIAMRIMTMTTIPMKIAGKGPLEGILAVRAAVTGEELSFAAEGFAEGSIQSPRGRNVDGPRNSA